MYEVDVRRALEDFARAVHNEEGTLLVREMGVRHGEARIDLAVVNGALIGYEIKSRYDNLGRLPHQIVVYGQVFDSVSLVADTTHLDKAHSMLPDYWGLLEVRDEGLQVLRPPSHNPDLNTVSVAHLLWCNELRAEMRSQGIPGVWRMPHRDLVNSLVREVDPVEVRRLVRDRLRRRPAWPAADAPQR